MLAKARQAAFSRHATVMCALFCGKGVSRDDITNSHLLPRHE